MSTENKTKCSCVVLVVSCAAWVYHFVKFSLASPTLSRNSWNTVVLYGPKCSRFIEISAEFQQGHFLWNRPKDFLRYLLKLLTILSNFALLGTCTPRVLLESVVESLSRNLSMYTKKRLFLEHAYQRIFVWIYEYIMFIFNNRNENFTGTKNCIVTCTAHHVLYCWSNQGFSVGEQRCSCAVEEQSIQRLCGETWRKVGRW